MSKNVATTPVIVPGIPLRSEEVFRRLVDSVRDYAIFLLDPHGYVATWNPGAERFKGYKAHEIIGQHFSVFYTQPDKDIDKPGWELKVAAEVGRFEDEGWRVRKDGTWFWANVTITCIKNDDGKVIGYGKITRDLSERRLAEQRYRLLIEGVTDYAIYSLDPEGKITSWNSGAERIKGYTAEEIVGQHFSQFYTPEDAARGLPQEVLRTAREQGHYEAEGWRVKKDGTRFWSSVVVTPLKDETGQVTGFSKITRDITERKKLIDEIQRHSQELELRIAEREQTNAELEAFSYSVSHDLRAPLRAIEGFSEALREEYSHVLDDTAQDYLHQVITAASRMNQLVQDLLNYSRLSRTDLPLQEVSAKSAIQRVIHDLAPEQQKCVTVTQFDDVRVIGHEATLAQVLMNLVTNGIKFHAPEVACEVVISVTRPRKGWIRFSVQDKGIGIAPEHQQRVFQVFERLHGIEEYPGTGVGLAIVKRGTERMEGRYGVQSAVRQGSTFWVELHAAQESNSK